jgi:hypothetical protein
LGLLQGETEVAGLQNFAGVPIGVDAELEQGYGVFVPGHVVEFAELAVAGDFFGDPLDDAAVDCGGVVSYGISDWGVFLVSVGCSGVLLGGRGGLTLSDDYCVQFFGHPSCHL